MAKASVSSKQPKESLTLGNISIEKGPEAASRLAMILWGQPGVGKTTLAATAPGKKLWLNLDPEGVSSVSSRDDVLVADLSGMSTDELMKQFDSQTNPLGLDTLLSQNEDIETVVFDSASAHFWRCLEHAVGMKLGDSKKSDFTPTLAAPGMTAYGGRTNIATSHIQRLMRVTAKHGRHCIVVAHEGTPDMKYDPSKRMDVVNEISTSLSKQAMVNVTWLLSEIWHLRDEGQNRGRWLSLRSKGVRRPMKSRMFDTEHGRTEFMWDFDANTGVGQTLEGWFQAWERGGKKKLPVPVGKGQKNREEDEEE